MRLICWNCQGLGSPLTIQAIRALVAKEKPAILFLMETKNKEDVVKRMQRKLQFRECFIVNPLGLAGRLAVFWNEQVTISIDSSSTYFVDVLCVMGENKQKMRITFVHAPTDFQDRLRLWDRIQQISCLNVDPWLCVGDFNEILYHWEKVGKRLAKNYRSKAFHDFLDACALMDLESKGCAYTWANNREVEALVKERLDRAVCNIAGGFLTLMRKHLHYLLLGQIIAQFY